MVYNLNHQGRPRILEWVAYPFSSRSSWPRNQIGVSCIAGRLFTSWATYPGGPYSLLYALSKWDSWSQLCSFLMPSSLWLYNAISPICTSQKSGKCSLWSPPQTPPTNPSLTHISSSLPPNTLQIHLLPYVSTTINKLVILVASCMAVKLNALKQWWRFYISYKFYESRVREWCSYMILSRGLSWVFMNYGPGL